MPFLLIGGHAVSAHGASRQTGDIDLLVQRSSKDKWAEFFQKIRYKASQDDVRFTRYTPDTIAAWPIDLMYVDDETFSKMLNEAISTEVSSVAIKIASVRHMIILKIHAMKYFQEHRFTKDYSDVIHLMKLHPQALPITELKTTCLKYGSVDIYEKLSNDLKSKQ